MKKKEPPTKNEFRVMLETYEMTVRLCEVAGLTSAVRTRRVETVADWHKRILNAYAAALEARRG